MPTDGCIFAQACVFCMRLTVSIQGIFIRIVIFLTAQMIQMMNIIIDKEKDRAQD